MCIHFSNNAKEEYASVVVAITYLSLVFFTFLQYDLGVTHVLWYGTFVPTLAEDSVQWVQKGSFVVLE